MFDFSGEIKLIHFVFLSCIIFCIGFLGVLINRKNLIVTLMSLELMLLSTNINFVSFSHFLNDNQGRIFTIFNIAIAAAEAAVALAIFVVCYRNLKTIEITEIKNLKG